MNDLYLLFWPVIVGVVGLGGVWLNSKVNPGIRPPERPTRGQAPVVRYGYQVARIVPRR